MDIKTHKLCRRTGIKICDNEKCPVQKNPYPPGIHGRSRNRRGLSEFGIQLLEKQKIRYSYGISEKQLKNSFQGSHSLDDFFRSLELRLDNAVFRMGFTSSRRVSRQLVSHEHFYVNGKKVNIPSYQLRTGDTINNSP